MSETLTWFGGHAGVIYTPDLSRQLHLIDDYGMTFCGISSELRPVTKREAMRDGCWCTACLFGATDDGSAALLKGGKP